MGYTNKTISTNTDEKTFIKKFVEELTAFQGITAVVPSGYADFNAYIDAQYALDSGTPTFTLMMRGFELVFTRNNAITAGTMGYTLKTDFTTSFAYFTFSSSTFAANVVNVRTLKFLAAANDNVTALYLGSYSSQILTFSAIGMSISSGLSAFAVSLSQGTRAIASTFSLSNDLAVVKVDRCNYTYDTENTACIEKIANKVFVVERSTDRIFTVNSLMDVSAVPAETKITIGDKDYFSLDNHTIMEV